jgi:hypothetical protein
VAAELPTLTIVSLVCKRLHNQAYRGRPAPSRP